MSKSKTGPGAYSVAVSVKTFARSVELSENTVYNLIASGDIAAIRLGRAVRIPISEYARLGFATPTFGEADAR
ncbi:helix-turn-helix domain-containing protein [Actinomyces ruminicola]|uniref:DNA binding domain-containing protein, excisionase family n=1 Tax=Actinomyces ruminicola TaxID=332524 RepID=A0A1G9SWU3_9ACTO|nr:helix-turn-helix domain-containing protein [Actinomyces ruminicola]SDM39928.1 DNA binding domain-containing protein, excisionase family [Actinomyces ruminicola]SDN95310.1 DNA binding domain-containing protein, excisionase family [Actinomyces ruminicola]